MSFQGVVNGSNPVVAQGKTKVYLRIFWTFDLCADPLVGWELAVLDVNLSRRLRASHSQPLMGEVAVGITRLSKRGIVFSIVGKGR